MVATVLSLGLIGIAATATAQPAGNGMPLPIDMDPPVTTVEVTVLDGDHLWKMSKAHLEGLWGREVSNGEVSPYWRRVIEENQSRIRSGDPDLIYPGETILMPSNP